MKKKLLLLLALCISLFAFAKYGTLDTTFTPGTGASAFFSAIALQSDGKIIIGDQFTT